MMRCLDETLLSRDDLDRGYEEEEASMAAEHGGKNRWSCPPWVVLGVKAVEARSVRTA